MPRPLRRHQYSLDSKNASGIAKIGNRIKAIDTKTISGARKVYDYDSSFTRVAGNDVTLHGDNANPSGITAFRGDMVVADQVDSNQYVWNGSAWEKQTLIDSTGLTGISVFHDTLIGVKNGSIQAQKDKSPFYGTSTIKSKDQTFTNNNPVSYSHLNPGEEKRLDKIEIGYLQTSINLTSSNTWGGMTPLPDGGYAILDVQDRKIIKYNIHGTKVDESTTQLPENCKGLALVGDKLWTAYVASNKRLYGLSVTNSAGFPAGTPDRITTIDTASAEGVYGWRGGIIFHYRFTSGSSSGERQFVGFGVSGFDPVIYNNEPITDFVLDEQYLYGVIKNQLVLHNEQLVFNGTITPTNLKYDLGSLFGSGFSFEGIDYRGDYFYFMAKSGSTHKIIKIPKSDIITFTKSETRQYYKRQDTHNYFSTPVINNRHTVTRPPLATTAGFQGIAFDNSSLHIMDNTGRLYSIPSEADSTLPNREIFDEALCTGLGFTNGHWLVATGQTVHEYTPTGAAAVASHNLAAGNGQSESVCVSGSKAYVLNSTGSQSRVFVYDINGETWTYNSSESWNVATSVTTNATGITTDGQNLFISDNTKIYRYSFSGTKAATEITLSPPTNYHGTDITYHNDKLYMLYGYTNPNRQNDHNNTTHYIQSITISTTTKKDTIPTLTDWNTTPTSPLVRGMSHDDTYLYSCPATNKLYRYRSDNGNRTEIQLTGRTAAQMSAPNYPVAVMVADGKYYVLINSDNTSSYIYRFNATTNAYETTINPADLGIIGAGICRGNNLNYIIDYDARKVLAYTTSWSRSSSNDITLPRDSSNANTKFFDSISFDGEHLIVVEVLNPASPGSGNRLLFFDPTTRQNVANLNIDLPSPTAQSFYGGSTVFGNIIYLQESTGRIKRFSLARNTINPNLQLQAITNDGTNLQMGVFPNKIDTYSNFKYSSPSLEISIATIERQIDIDRNGADYDILFEKTDDRFYFVKIDGDGDVKQFAGNTSDKLITKLNDKDPVGMAYDGTGYYVLDNSEKKIYYFDESFNYPTDPDEQGDFLLDSDHRSKYFVGMAYYADNLYMLTTTGEILQYNTGGGSSDMGNLLIQAPAGYHYADLTKLGEHLYALLTNDTDATSYLLKVPLTRTPQTFTRNNIQSVTIPAAPGQRSVTVSTININCMAVTNGHFFFGDSNSSLIFKFNRRDPSQRGTSYVPPNLVEGGQQSICAESNSDNANIYSLGSVASAEIDRYNTGTSGTATSRTLSHTLRYSNGNLAAAVHGYYYDPKTDTHYVTDSSNWLTVDSRGVIPHTVRNFNALENHEWDRIFYVDGHVYLNDSGDWIFYAFNASTGAPADRNIDLYSLLGVEGFDASAFDGENLYIAIQDSTTIKVYTFHVATQYLGEEPIVINKLSTDAGSGVGSPMIGLDVDNDKIYAGFNVPNIVASFNLNGSNRQTELTNGNNTRIFYFSRDGRWTYGLYFDASIHTTAIRLFYDKAPITGFNIPITGFTGNARDQNHGVGIVRRGDEFIILSSNKISRYSLTGTKLGKEKDAGLGSQYNYIGGFTIGTNRIYAAISSTRTIHYWDFDLNHLGSFSINAPAPDISGLGYDKGKLYLLVNHNSDDHFQIQPITVTEFDNPTATFELANLPGKLLGCTYGDQIYVTTRISDSRGTDVEWMYIYTTDGRFISFRAAGIFGYNVSYLAYKYIGGEGNFILSLQDDQKKLIIIFIPYQSVQEVTFTNEMTARQGLAVIGNTIYILTSDTLYTTVASPLFTRTLAAGTIPLPVKRDWAGMTSDGKRLYLLEKKSKDEITKVYVFDPSLYVASKVTDGRVRLAEIEIGKLGQDIVDIMYKDGALYLMYEGTNKAQFLVYDIKSYQADYDIQYNNNQKLLATDGQYNFTSHEGKITRVGKHTRNTKDLVSIPDSHIATNSITLKRTINLTYTNRSGSPNALGSKDGKLYVFTSNGQVFEVDPETETQTVSQDGSLGEDRISGAVWDGERWVVTDRSTGAESIRVYSDDYTQSTDETTIESFTEPGAITFFKNHYYVFAGNDKKIWKFDKQFHQVGTPQSSGLDTSSPAGFTTDGTYLYYTLETQNGITRVDENLGNSITLNLPNLPNQYHQGMTFMGNTLYVLNEDPNQILVYDLLTGSGLGGIEYKGTTLSVLDGSKLVNYDLEGSKLGESNIEGLTKPISMTNMNGKAYILESDHLATLTNNKVDRNYHIPPNKSSFKFTHSQARNYFPSLTANGNTMYCLEQENTDNTMDLISFVTTGSNITETNVTREALAGAAAGQLHAIAYDPTNANFVTITNNFEFQRYDTEGAKVGGTVDLPDAIDSGDGMHIQNDKIYLLDDKKIYIFGVNESTPRTNFDAISLPSDFDGTGITGDGEHLWVIDTNNNKMQCYNPDTKQHVDSLSFDIGSPTSGYVYWGCTFINRVLYVVQGNTTQTDSIFDGYELYTDRLQFNLGTPVDITNDGQILYIATAATKTIYAFDAWRRRPDRDVRLHAELSVTGIAFADNKLHVTTSNGHVFHYTVTEVTAAGASSSQTLPTSNFTPTGVAVRGDYVMVLNNVAPDTMKGYKLQGAGFGEYTPLDYNFANDTPNSPDKVQGMDVDGYTAFVINREKNSVTARHQVYLYDIRPQFVKNLVSKFNILAVTIRTITKPFVSKFNINSHAQVKQLISKFDIGDILNKGLISKFDIAALSIIKPLISKFNVESHTLKKDLISKFNIAAFPSISNLISKFNIQSHLLKKDLISKFNVEALMVTKSLSSFFYILGLTRRLASFDIALPPSNQKPTAITRVGRYFYIAELDSRRSDYSTYVIDSITKQNVASRRIILENNNGDTYLDNDEPNGLGYYNNILYCLNYDGGFETRLFRYNPETRANIYGQVGLYNIDRYELDGAEGIAIDKNGTLYVVAPDNYEGIGHVTKKPRLCIYNSIPTSGFGGPKDEAAVYPDQEIVINGTERGVAVNDDFVVTVGTDFIVRFYDKNNNYALVPNRQFTLPRSVVGSPTGCHLDGDILWVVDQQNPETIHAFSIAFIKLRKDFILKFNISGFGIIKNYVFKFNISKFPAVSNLISKFNIPVLPATKNLISKFNIQSHTLKKDLISKFKIGSLRAVTPTLISKFNIQTYRIQGDLISKFILESSKVVVSLISKFNIFRPTNVQIIEFKSPQTQYIQFNND